MNGVEARGLEEAQPDASQRDDESSSLQMPLQMPLNIESCMAG